jgi:hypothetical protein
MRVSEWMQLVIVLSLLVDDAMHRKVRTQKNRPYMGRQCMRISASVSVCDQVRSAIHLCMDSSSESVSKLRQSFTPVDVTQWRTLLMREAPRNSRPGTITIFSVGFTMGRAGRGMARATFPMARVARASRVIFI